MAVCPRDVDVGLCICWQSLETELLVQHIHSLKMGLSVQLPTYDFATHSRTTETIDMEPRKIVLVSGLRMTRVQQSHGSCLTLQQQVEGILLFSYPELVKELEIKVFVVSTDLLVLFASDMSLTA